MIAEPIFSEMLKNQSELGRDVSIELAKKSDELVVRLIEMLTLSAKNRVCAEILRLAQPIGIEPGKHIIRPVPVFVDLAQRINSTRETVSRTVSELQNKGILSRVPGALVITKPGALKKAINE